MESLCIIGEEEDSRGSFLRKGRDQRSAASNPEEKRRKTEEILDSVKNSPDF